MKTLQRLLGISLIAMMVSCNAYQAINTQDLSMGMTKKEVFSILNREPIQEYADSNVEIYRVRKRIVRGGIAEYQQYFLYFEKNQLVKIDKGERAVDYRIRIN